MIHCSVAIRFTLINPTTSGVGFLMASKNTRTDVPLHHAGLSVVQLNDVTGLKRLGKAQWSCKNSGAVRKNFGWLCRQLKVHVLGRMQN